MSPELAVISLFAVATGVALLARRLKVPYTVALVIAGIALGSSNIFEPPHLTKDLLFAVFLPGLVFEAAFAINARELWQNKITVAALAFPGVLVATAATAALIVLTGQLAWGAGLLFAAIVSATDPIAVISVFKAVGAPHRLRLLVEGESLLNDGTGVVIFGIVLAAVSSGHISFGGGALDFLRIVGTGAVAGVAIGLVISELIRRIDDPMLETTLTTIAAYGSFLIAEHFHGSGVIATVAAGLLCGNYAATTGMGAATRLAVANFWEYLAFALNSIVFLLIGFEVGFQALVDSWRPILLAYVAVTAGRALVVAVVGGALRRTRERFPASWAAVLTWGGMRGGLSMVLALALPSDIPERATIIIVTFGVVIVSILLQGSTMALLLARMGLSKVVSPELRELETLRFGAKAAHAAVDAIEYAVKQREVLPAAADAAKKPYLDRIAAGEKRMIELGVDRTLEVERDDAVKRALLAEKAALLDAGRAGAISDESLRSLLADVDARLIALTD